MLEITVCLAITVFLMLVSQMTPATSEDVPLISVFFSVCLMAVSTAVAFTVIVLNYHHTSPRFAKMRPLVSVKLIG